MVALWEGEEDFFRTKLEIFGSCHLRSIFNTRTQQKIAANIYSIKYLGGEGMGLAAKSKGVRRGGVPRRRSVLAARRGKSSDTPT